jgi:uncharacterized protein YyaL (SSP411 family)
MNNRLENETSLYLQQHKTNPVDWYPWGEEAFQIAKELDKPIFLSIGYSSCHWCHVMAEESFSNLEIAEILNSNYISIKVDREERPDIDSIYMDAVQAMSGTGGWPLSVFLTPDKLPFFGGTYYPPEDRPGMPGFPKVLQHVLDAFKTLRPKVEESGKGILEHIERSMSRDQKVDKSSLDVSVLNDAFEKLNLTYDKINGGFGTMPKFPQAPVLDFLLRYYTRNPESNALKIVEHTLQSIAAGGIHDQLVGGFHRYSTDSNWTVPHFEKMLYDNALLSLTYLNTFKITKDNTYKAITEMTLNFMINHMSNSDGYFVSSIDADSDGIEGNYYLWSLTELQESLPLDNFPKFEEIFELGKEFSINEIKRSTILSKKNSEGTPIRFLIDEKAVSELDQVLSNLTDSRSKRVHPRTDSKVITSWNGLVLRSLAEAGSALNNSQFIAHASRLAELILDDMKPSNSLRHISTNNSEDSNGYLEDYSHIVNGLLSLFEATSNKDWLTQSLIIADQMIDLFWDKDQSVFFDSPNTATDLIIRPNNILDNAIPSGASAATEALLRLNTITGRGVYKDIAEQSLLNVKKEMTSFPGAVSQWLSCLDYNLGPSKEIVIIGELDDQITIQMRDLIASQYLPNKVMLVINSEEISSWDHLPIMDGKVMLNNKTTAYVCENYACKLPVNDVDLLKEQISSDSQLTTNSPFKVIDSSFFKEHS